MAYRKKKGSFGKILILIILIGIIGGLLYLYNSIMFEQNKPTISIKKTLHWNLKKPIPITIKDDSGIKFVRVILSDGNNTTVLVNKVFKNAQKVAKIEARYPKTAFSNKAKNLSLHVDVADVSMWNYFMGNEAKKIVPIQIDTKKPNLYILTNSYSIARGGVGTVIFKANDENLEKLYIKTDAGDIFRPEPFYKDEYYISLIAWKHNAKKFEANIIAEDKAGNQTKERIRFYLVGKKYKISKIKATDKFIDGKINELAEKYATEEDMASMNNLEKFRFINETLRKGNEDKINKVSSKVSNDLISSFYLYPFYPLRNAAAVASFGDYRFYSYKGKQVSESYHLGLDLASTSEADIIASNKGTVVFAETNGIYGNNLIISHGLGVYSLYGHCSRFTVSLGDKVKKGEIVAKTGLTGLALGDHLHFGILVQGVEVRPEEWMDDKWFKNNISSVIDDAKKMIDKK